MNSQPDSHNFYERLGISQEATFDQIKKAFFTEVKKYTPDKSPEQYKLIREAYDTLKTPNSKEEYDMRFHFGKDIDDLERRLEEARDAENDLEQVNVLKQLIIIIPTNASYKNKLGWAFYRLEKYDDALKQFGKASQIDPNNSQFFLNQGIVLEKMEKYIQAEQNYQIAWDLDPNDYEAPRKLGNMYYFAMKDTQKSIKTFKRAIESDGQLDFQDFFCLFDLGFIYLLESDEQALKDNLRTIIQIAVHPEDKDYAATRLGELANLLASKSLYPTAILYADTANKLVPTEFNQECLDFITEISKVMDDKSLPITVNYLINGLGQTFYDGYTKEEENHYYETLTSFMRCKNENEDVKRFVRTMKSKYPTIYRIEEKFLNKLLDFTPSMYRDKCPSCSKLVNVDLYDYGTYTCPHCSRSIVYGSSGYSSYGSGGYSSGSSSSTTSSSGSGCLISIVAAIVPVVTILLSLF